MRPELRQAVAALHDALHQVPEDRLQPRLWVLGRTHDEPRRIARFSALSLVLDALLRAIYCQHPMDELDVALDRIGRELADLATANTPWTWCLLSDRDKVFALLNAHSHEIGLTVELVLTLATAEEQREVRHVLGALLGVLLGATPCLRSEEAPC